MKRVCLYLFVLFLFSCQQEEEIPFVDNEKTELSSYEENIVMNDGTTRFIYKGVEYVSDYQTEGEAIIFQNEIVARLVKTLSQNKVLASYIHSNGVLEYFDSPSDLENSILSKSSLSTKAGLNFKVTESAVLTVFEDSKCKGEEWKFTINSGTTHFKVEYVGEHWNDRISSIDMVCNYRNSSGDNPYPTIANHGDKCIATFYEHRDFGGYSISFTVDPNYPHSYIHYFKSYSLYPGSKKTWNDEVSSLQFSFDWWKN